MNRESTAPSIAVATCVTALVYAVVGALAMWIAVPPGSAPRLFASAGVALACVLVYGWPVLVGVAIGSFAVNLAAAMVRAQLDGVSVLMSVTIALGAALQAGFGAWLVRRHVNRPLVLSEPRDVASFLLLGAAAACTVNATVATLAMAAAGLLPVARLPSHWWNWWTGDALGTLIGAPVTLTLIGRPRTDWVHRRKTVGWSLALVGLLLVGLATQVARWDEERAGTIFQRDAASAANDLGSRLYQPLNALQGVLGVYLASHEVSRDEMHKASRAWLGGPTSLQAIGFAQRVSRRGIVQFESEVLAEGVKRFRVYDRGDAAGKNPARDDDDVVAIRYIEPNEGNVDVLGVNALSVDATRQAILQAWRTGEPVASPGFRLGKDTGIVVVQAVYNGEPQTDAERQEAMVGIVFVALRTDRVVSALMVRQPSYLHWCLTDVDPQAAQRRLAGEPGCEAAAPAGLAYRRTLPFADRQWQLHVAAKPDAVPDVRRWNAWLFTLVGLVATSMLAALLLTVTGRARRIEVAVADRTADLQREVGEHTRTEAALRESEQRVRNILDHVPIGVAYMELDGRFRECNPKLREMLGYGADELGAMTSTQLTHPDDRAAEARLTERLLRGEIPLFRRQKRYVAKDGRTVWVRAMTTVLRDGAGQPQRLLGVVEDITEQLKLQEAERARERAEAANRAKNDFLSRMSHELRTPLNAMLGFAQLLDLDRQPALAQHQLDWTSQIQQAGWHLLHMINDTLDLSRIEAGTLRLAIEGVDLQGVVRATRALLEQTASRRRITVSERLDPKASTVLGDETRIKQILTNLLSNAIKYNVEGGHVKVTSRLRDANTVEIEVRDTGLGMTPEQLRELFQPFNRLGREASGTEGTGIGLVISQRLAELMGGTLQAQSAPDTGSTFFLSLPRAEQVAVTATDEGDKPSEAIYRHRLVHYVEDNETNAEVMRGILAQRPQIKLEVSATGADGLAMIRRRVPSLVLLDMHLPDIDGIEILRRLKQHDDTADIPVVVVSADATSARIEEALTLGAANYLTKPVNVAQILAVLDEQLERLDTRFG